MSDDFFLPLARREGAPRRVTFEPAIVFDTDEAARMRRATVALFGPAPPEPLAAITTSGGGALALARPVALDCAVALVQAADCAAASGECVISFALLGMESRLLEELVGEGSRSGREH